MDGIKNSVAIVIYNSDKTKLLVVQRPPDDDSLPNVWGLPAASLKEGETFEEAVLRTGKDKLGVDVEIVGLTKEGEIDRNGYKLFMKEFEVKIVSGKSKVPQSIEGVTQYTKLDWDTPDRLIEAAQKGSLYSRLYLSSIGRTW